MQAATSLLVGQAVSGSHGAIDRALEDFQHLAAEAKDEKIATVRTARELADERAGAAAQALSQQYATPVHLQVVVDPDVVGGLRVEIGDDVIDGTVASRSKTPNAGSPADRTQTTPSRPKIGKRHRT